PARARGLSDGLRNRRRQRRPAPALPVGADVRRVPRDRPGPAVARRGGEEPVGRPPHPRAGAAGGDRRPPRHAQGPARRRRRRRDRSLRGREDEAMKNGLPPGFDPAAVRAIVTDMDRTILPSSLELSPKTVAAIAAVRAAGIEAIIATGRMFASTRPYALELGITAPVICYQGALVADPTTGHWLLHRPIDVPTALEVIHAVRPEGFHMNVYVDDQLVVEK